MPEVTKRRWTTAKCPSLKISLRIARLCDLKLKDRRNVENREKPLRTRLGLIIRKGRLRRRGYAERKNYCDWSPSGTRKVKGQYLPNTSCIRQLNACWNSVYWRIFDFKLWKSVRELIMCLERMNLEYLYYQKKLCFFNSMMCSANSVIMSVVEVFIHSVEYSKLCNFVYLLMIARLKIKRRVSAKYATSIVSWLKILYSRDIPDIDDMCVYILLLFYIVSAFLCEINVIIIGHMEWTCTSKEVY